MKSEAVRTHRYRIRGTRLKIIDQSESQGSNIVADELSRDEYSLDSIPFSRGDLVVDVGGHVGTFAIYLARRYPGIRVYSYEPLPANYELFRKNLDLNKVDSVEVFNEAVTSDGRSIRLLVHPSNTAGATAQVGTMDLAGHEVHEVRSLTLDEIVDRHGIEKGRLLKIDCEGSEYEVLLSANCLERFEFFSAEFHENSYLREKGYTTSALDAHLRRFIDPSKISYKTVPMADY